MKAKQTKTRLYDVIEFNAKVLNSLKTLEKTQNPGEQKGKGTKTLVLESVKTQIQDLVKKGYTTKQIADAISSDAFGILPKTITQLISSKSDPATSKTTRKKTRTRHANASESDAIKPSKTQAKEITDVE